MFRANQFDTRLGTHKLHGPMRGLSAYSVDYHYRVIFFDDNKGVITYYDIGTHDLYQ